MQKRMRQISSHLDQTNLANERFIIWPKDYTKEFHFCGNKAGNPEQARYAYLALLLGTNQNTGFGPSCPLVEPAI